MQANTCSKSAIEALEKSEISSNLTLKDTIDVNDFVFLFLVWSLKMFHTFCYCFYCWVWTGNCLLDIFKALFHKLCLNTFIYYCMFWYFKFWASREWSVLVNKLLFVRRGGLLGLTMLHRADRAWNYCARIFVRFVETIGARLHHEKTFIS